MPWHMSMNPQPRFAFLRRLCHILRMFFSITRAGSLARVWSLNGHDEVMLHCARVGFKP
jgi:hypothetical protein